jgi:DNA-binding response OmpR family regulator
MGERIAVVDDEPLQRSIVVDFLVGAGFAATGLDGGASLRAVLQVPPLPDLILLDLMMPGENGLSVLRWLRSVSAVPVILLTATDDITERLAGLDLGADDYVAKPAHLPELVARIRWVLKRRTQRSV